APRVVRLCDECLPRPGLASDEDGRVTGGNFGHSGQDGRERWRGADNLFEHRRLIDFLSQRHVFLLQPLLRTLAIVDVGMEHIPASDLAFVVADWIEPREKPRETSVGFAQPQLQRMGGLSAGLIAPACPVVRMNDFTVILPPLFKSEACVIKRSAVGIETLEVRSEYDDELRSEVHHLP